MLCSVPFVSGWVIMAASQSITLLYIGRVVTGLAIGAISLTVPVYIIFIYFLSIYNAKKMQYMICF